MATQVIDSLALVPAAEQQVQIGAARNKLLERAQSLVIDSPETEAIGWGLINGIADLKKSITEDFEPARKAADLAKKAVLAQRDGHINKLIEPDKIVRGKLASWGTEKWRAQEAAERKAREEAEAERRRLQAIADEAARAENERRRKEAEEKRIQEAIESERNGKAEVAAAILEKPIEISPVVAAMVSVAPSVVPQAFAKVEGAGSMVDDWRFRVTNEDLIPDAYWVRDDSAIAKVVKALKKMAEKTIPGIEVYNDPKPRTTARR